VKKGRAQCINNRQRGQLGTSIAEMSLLSSQCWGRKTTNTAKARGESAGSLKKNMIGDLLTKKKVSW